MLNEICSVYTPGQIRKQDEDGPQKASVLPQNSQASSASPFCHHILGDDTSIGVTENQILISHICPWALVNFLPADCPLILIIWGLLSLRDLVCK